MAKIVAGAQFSNRSAASLTLLEICFAEKIGMLQELYQKHALPALKETLRLENSLAAPKILKVVVNTGVGKTLSSAPHPNRELEETERDFTAICGQKPVRTRARASIAGFKLREGTVAGLKVTLRGKRMYAFLDRLIQLVLPRTRDFRGLDPESIDGEGNLTIGIREHTVFPEISQEDVHKPFGMEVTVVVRASGIKEAQELFRTLGFPFRPVKAGTSEA